MTLLSLFLLVVISLLVPATLLVLTVGAPRGRRTDGVFVVGAVLVVALLALALAGLWGGTPTRSALVAVAVGASVLVWWSVARDWDPRGLIAWGLAFDAGLAYLTYVLVWTLTADLGWPGRSASLALWTLELFVFVIGTGYVWEFVDVLSRRRWPRALDPTTLSQEQRAHRPFVSLHVPTHNEPSDMVVATLQRLLELEYDDYEVLLVDNNTTDPDLWRPVEEFCALHERLVFIHLEDWPGYKSGALNYALTRTDPRAELIGIVDADYRVAPDFLARCAPLFADAGVGFIQTPQDYRDWKHAPYFRRLYHSYGYFFTVSQRSRNERDGAIFGGTMGLIRRSVLASVGGWDEWCITEDAELSLRILREGHSGVHVEQSYGHGVMPLTFEALKRQRFRWCFGGIQIMRMHWRSLLPGRRTAKNRLSAGQRWAYLCGGLQWFADLAGVAFTGFLLLGAVDALWGEGLVIRRLSGVLILCVAVVLVVGLLRALSLIRRTGGATWREAAGAFFLWLGLGWTVAQASVRGLVAREGAFLRTPKVRGELDWRDAVRGNKLELVMGAVCLLTGVGVLVSVAADETTQVGISLVGVLLLVQATGFFAAPVNSWAAIRSDLPRDLRRVRGAGLVSWERLAGPARRGGLVLAGLAFALVALVVFAAPLGVPDLTELPTQVEEDDPVERDDSQTVRDDDRSPRDIDEPITRRRRARRLRRRPRARRRPGRAGRRSR